MLLEGLLRLKDEKDGLYKLYKRKNLFLRKEKGKEIDRMRHYGEKIFFSICG